MNGRDWKILARIVMFAVAGFFISLAFVLQYVPSVRGSGYTEMDFFRFCALASVCTLIAIAIGPQMSE